MLQVTDKKLFCELVVGNLGSIISFTLTNDTQPEANIAKNAGTRLITEESANLIHALQMYSFAHTIHYS